VKLAIRRGGDEFVWRYESEWPIGRTEWTEYYLDASNRSLSMAATGADATAICSSERSASDEVARVRFSTDPFETETEITGPIKLALWVASTTCGAPIIDLNLKCGHAQPVRCPHRSAPQRRCRPRRPAS
jgi:uncharacterized protein